MPMSQVVQVLETHWGKGWEQGFERFSFTPCAAASIGQVHRARTRDGQELDNISPRRYFCTQCHVAQTDAKPLVENGFKRARGLQ